MGKIRVGVIGLGGISDVHIKGIQNSPDAELAAVCDIDEDVLKSKGNFYMVPENNRFNNHIDLLKAPNIDAVTICTPNNSHYKIALDVIKNRKPFALEKPITLNYNEALELEKLIEENNIKNMVCFSYRFKAAARFARWIINQGQLGEIYHVYVQYLQSWGISEEVPLLWRFEKEKSGSGSLADLGSHAIDLVSFLVGDFKKVCCHSGTFIKSRKKINSSEYGPVDVDDYCHLMAELEGNIPVTLGISRYAFGRMNYQKIEIYGSKGSLVYNLEREDSIEICVGDLNGKLGNYNKVEIPQEFKCDQMQEFIDIINDKGDGLAATFKDGLKNQLFIDAAIESFEKEKWIYIDSYKKNRMEEML